MANKYLDQNGLLYFWGKIKTLLNAKVTANGGITGATKTKISYDSKGLITGGEDATTADIPDSLNKRYVSDDQKTAIGNLGGTNTGDETVERLGALINGATTKTTPVDADSLALVDSASSNVVKKWPFANVKAALKLYFDNVYTAKNGAITGATKVKISYDSKGLVTAGADLLASDIPDLSSTYIVASQKGQANGIATLDSSGLIPSAQLPSFVDDVVECVVIQTAANTPATPVTCSTGQKYYNYSEGLIHTATGTNTWGSGVTPLSDKIYLDISTNISYRWGGSVMVAITSTDMVAVTNAEIDVVVAS